MALPTLQRKLFQNDGYGPLLKDEIVSKHISVQDWSNAYDYPVATVVRGSDGLLYYSVAQSGPNAGGAQDPTADAAHAYWTSPKVPAMPSTDVSDSIVTSQWVASWVASQRARTDLYVDIANGNDSNDGTQSHPYKTINAALDSIRNAAVKPSACTIHIAAGNYGSTLAGISGVSLTYIGEGSGVYLNAIYAIGNVSINLGGHLIFKADPSGYGTSITITRNSTLNILNGAVIEFTGSNSSKNLIWISNGSFFGFTNNSSVTFKFNNNATAIVLAVSFLSQASLAGANITWSGSVTGRKYSVNNISLLYASGGANNIPGTIAGIVDSSSVVS